MMSAWDWLEDLVQPVVIVTDGPENSAFTEVFQDHRLIVWKKGCERRDKPWPWFPQNVSIYGIGRPGEKVHIWFAGQPVGQEEASWRDLMLAVGRGKKLLTPVAEQMAAEIVKPVNVAVFTTPS